MAGARVRARVRVCALCLKEDAPYEVLQPGWVAVVAQRAEGRVGPGASARCGVGEVDHAQQHPPWAVGPRDEAGGNSAEADAEEVEQVAVAGGPGEEV